jgi:MoxR-like ATPase
MVFLDCGRPHPAIRELLPGPPPWRTFADPPPYDPAWEPPRPPDPDLRRRLGPADRRGGTLGRTQVELVNAAILLRRPLLVSGKPGSGKSSLPYSIAHELGLGRVLRWPVTSRSTLTDGLYAYDAVGRLQEAGMRAGFLAPHAPRGRHAPGEDRPTPTHRPPSPGEPDDIGRFLRLGPLGTALLPYRHPRVLLIDEIDKSDLEFPGDLLNVMEDGEFGIPELARIKSESSEVAVSTDDPDGAAVIHRGRVHCSAFPIIVMTSNGEREFPPAFYRRCIRLDLVDPGPDELRRIVEAQLGEATAAAADALIGDFLRRRDEGDRPIATDQLLNAVYLRMSDLLPDSLREGVFRPIDGADG